MLGPFNIAKSEFPRFPDAVMDNAVASLPRKEHIDGRRREWVCVRSDLSDRPTCQQCFEVVKNRTASGVQVMSTASGWFSLPATVESV